MNVATLPSAGMTSTTAPLLLFGVHCPVVFDVLSKSSVREEMLFTSDE
jgi:hypothetical protein